MSAGIMAVLAILSFCYLIEGIKGIISNKRGKRFWEGKKAKASIKAICLGILGFLFVFIYLPR
jgi:hypothetical protein